MTNILDKYAALLVNYCLDIKEKDKLFIQTTTLAEPLVRAVYKEATLRGAHIEVDMSFAEKNGILINNANQFQLESVPILYKTAMETFDAYLHIRAPFNLREDQNINAANAKIRSNALKPISDAYFKRTATRELKRNLCQYPTQASAQEAGMSLSEYEIFVFTACNLYTEDPIQAWLDVRKSQQHIVDHLNKCTKVRYVNAQSDIEFSTKGRIWMNSDGQTNMPSGEIYTSPVEDSVNGKIHFTLPSIYGGNVVDGVTLWVKDGFIEKWDANSGKAYLDYIFSLEGTRRFGEAAIGTNYNIQKITKNILFDEKIGGTIHMAIGQSYLQTGGKNESAIHWDMITDMVNGGAIYADDKLIYENGKFIL
jgi:aminopeptidase